ncbi:MAG: hypothetical protein WCF65_08200 [Parachlamydiaceae bacterium]
MNKLRKHPYFHPSKLIPIKILPLDPAYLVKLPHTTRRDTQTAASRPYRL